MLLKKKKDINDHTGSLWKHRNQKVSTNFTPTYFNFSLYYSQLCFLTTKIDSSGGFFSRFLTKAFGFVHNRDHRAFHNVYEI